MDNQTQVRVDSEFKGVYSNAMTVTHTSEDFCLDFFHYTGPFTQLNARVVVTPGHMKRLVKSLTDNLTKYELMFGEVKEPAEEERV